MSDIKSRHQISQQISQIVVIHRKMSADDHRHFATMMMMMITINIIIVMMIIFVQGVFLTGTPPKSSKYKQFNLG